MTEEITCPTPGKSRFATGEAAESSARRNALAVGKPLRPYECVCGWHHLTSKPPQAHEPKPDVTAQVAQLGDRAFRDLVNADLAGKADPDQAGALRTAEVVDRWEATLKQVEIALMAELTARRSERGPDVDAWRSRVQLRRGWIAARRREARVLQRAMTAARQGAEQRAAVERSVARDAERSRAAEELRRANPAGVAGEAAVKRLIAAHQAEFMELLVEEYAAAGVEFPARLARRLESHRAEGVLGVAS